VFNLIAMRFSEYFFILSMVLLFPSCERREVAGIDVAEATVESYRKEMARCYEQFDRLKVKNSEVVDAFMTSKANSPQRDASGTELAKIGRVRVKAYDDFHAAAAFFIEAGGARAEVDAYDFGSYSGAAYRD